MGFVTSGKSHMKDNYEEIDFILLVGICVFV